MTSSTPARTMRSLGAAALAIGLTLGLALPANATAEPPAVPVETTREQPQEQAPPAPAPEVETPALPATPDVDQAEPAPAPEPAPSAESGISLEERASHLEPLIVNEPPLDALRDPATAPGTQADPNAVTNAAPRSNTAATVTATGGTKRFLDVPKGHKFYKPIMWMYQTGLTTGVKNARGVSFLPSSQLTREAEAAFLYREAGNPSFKMPKQRFKDVGPSHKFYKPIMWMKAGGLTTGIKTKQGLKFEPSWKLSREAMAAFLHRVAGKPGFTAKNGFPDVKRGDKFYRQIMWMQSAGLTTGIKTDTGIIYDPKRTVTREAMAAFMYRNAGSPEFIDSGTVKLAGTIMVGETVTASASGWTPSSIAYSTQWMKNGKAIPGATEAKYTLTPEDEGAKLQVKISGSLPNTKSVTMTTTPIIVKGLEVIPGTVKITGTPEATKTITATASGWVPAAAVISYQWHRAGTPINGATGASYTLTTADIGQKVTVRLSGTLAGYKTASLTSNPVTVKPKQITVAEATETVRQTIFSEVNRIRTGYGLNALEWAPQYARGANDDSKRQLDAYLKTGDLAGHVPRITYWQNYGFDDPSEIPYDVLAGDYGNTPERIGKDMVAGWMLSPGHCWWVLRESSTHMYPGVALTRDSNFNAGGGGGMGASMLAFRLDYTWDEDPNYNDQDPSWVANQVCR
ncbi:S-layer homology domain-containing protein [Leucobacter chromiireducens]|uniref:SLH domain-containing protein n=1 Tax=Leucobacter chromiireducens subsp. solipictus TaxID=398235 RepID=A0ABS1SH04_9MICO|nr:S-layer homology domain-containing protein [Leucobacter chromiireducens]MBL3678558.1 hypothetical protein [Leucobacter chromiireducens subsp. solipictus]